MSNLFGRIDFFDSATYGKPGLYKPQKDDDRTKLQLHSWLKLHNSYGLLSNPVIEDSRIAMIRFSRTSEIISTVYDQIRRKTKDVGCLLEDGDTHEVYLRVLFQISHLLVSFHNSFSSFEAYNDVLKYIFQIVSHPTREIICREKGYISIVESITKCIDGGSCKEGDLEPLFCEVFKIARDPKESLKRMDRFHALTVLFGQPERIVIDDISSASSSAPLSLSSIVDFPTDHFENEIKNTRDLLQHSEVKPLVAGMKICELENVQHCILKGLNILELSSRKFTETTRNDVMRALSEIQQLIPQPELQQAAGCDQSSNKFKWILLILKQMISQFKNHAFVPDLEFEYIKTKATEDDVKLDLPNSIENCDLELLFSHVLSKYMTRHSKFMKDQILEILRTSKARDCDEGKHAHLDVESYGLLLYIVDHVSQMKKDFGQRLEEIHGKINFCENVYVGSDVCPKLNILYVKKVDIVKNLTSDLRYGCDYIASLSPEIVSGFKMLTNELNLSGLESNYRG